MFEDALLPADPVRAEAARVAWHELIGPGVVLADTERIAVIGWARAAWAGAGAPDPNGGAMAEAAHWLAVDAGGLRAASVDDFERRGLDRWAYLEVVGVVSRLANIDFYARGLGAALPEAPAALGHAPSGRTAGDGGRGQTWVPMAGPAIAPYMLDALPAEGDALRALHEPMYMPFAEMGDGAYADTLARHEIEYLAARVSYLNECFY